MAITENMGPLGVMTVTTPSATRMRETERHATSYWSPKMEDPVLQNQLHNNHQKSPRLPHVDDKARKEKKWSLGKLFRRKKKGDSASSSETEDTSNKLEHRRKKPKKKSHFDYIDVKKAEVRRAQSVTKNPSSEYIDEGILSDPSAGFVGFIGRGLPRLPNEAHLTSRDSLDKRGAGSSCGSQDGSLRKGRKGRMKARVEAIRNSMRHESSSDEESQKSSTSSSMIRFRSDDSLTNSRDGSFNKKSRSARTERYIKRLSRDDENQLNKEAELLKKGHSKSEIELIMRSRSATNDYANIVPTTKENNNYVNIVNKVDYPKPPKLSNSISTVQTFAPASIHFNAKVNDENVTYSVPYQNNRTISDTVSYNSLNSYSNDNDNVMIVKFPLGNKAREEKAPPVPPRRLTTPVSAIYENSKYTQPTYSVMRNHSTSNMFMRRPISSSEDHIAMQENYYNGRSTQPNTPQPRRPASVSAEPTRTYFQNYPSHRSYDNKRTTLPANINNNPDLVYYADQAPRSRKPIHIRMSQSNLDQRYDSQSSLPHSENSTVHYPPKNPPKNASEFWRRIDVEENNRRRINNLSRTKAMSDQTNFGGMLSPNKFIVSPSYKPFHDNVIKPMAHRVEPARKSPLYRNTAPARDEVDHSAKIVQPQKPQPQIHVRHKSESQVFNFKRYSSDDESRKSTNLDEALSELEAIYNSLGLGDEDLLDRAERREQMLPKAVSNGVPNVVIRPYSNNRYPAKRLSIPDKVNDDMAYRRFNFKEKSPKDVKNATSNVSYMLASPIMNNHTGDDDKHSDAERTEPDVVLDDVVYRNIKHAKNHLKVIEPQPPFGIPLGPISPAPQSDYLHASVDTRYRPRFTARKSPDLVSDDLAFRTLRKDTLENGVVNTPNAKETLPNMKKKRAVRSLSANIFSMIQKEIDDALNMSRLATMERAQSITDLNKSLKQIVSENKTKNEKIEPALKTKTAPPATNRKYTREEFNEAIDVLEKETKDTSDKLGIALAELESIDTSKIKVCEDRKDESTAAKSTEDSLIAISNQLQIVENKIKSNVDRKINFVDEKVKLDNIQNKINISFNNRTDLTDEGHKIEAVQGKLNEMLKSGEDFSREKEKIEEITKTAQDYIRSQEVREQRRAECVPQTSGYTDLKNDITNIINEISAVNSRFNMGNSEANSNENLEYNSSEELATIFKSEEATTSADTGKNRSEGDLHSPSLVKNADNTLRKISTTESPDITSACIPHQRQNAMSSSQSTTCVPWRKNRAPSNPGPSNSDDNLTPSKSRSWYHDPGNVMLACSYTLACSQQLAGLDALTILGLILAMISIIAMLII